MRREVPTDEQVLNTMCIVYRRANRMKDLSAAFAAASTAHPQDKGLLRGVFVSYVRQALIPCATSTCPVYMKYSNVAQAAKHGSLDNCIVANNPALTVQHRELQHPQHVDACLRSQPLANSQKHVQRR